MKHLETMQRIVDDYIKMGARGLDARQKYTLGALATGRPTPPLSHAIPEQFTEQGLQ